MKRNGFIKVTSYDESLKPKERKPIGTVLVNVDEIAMIVCTEYGSVVFLKDYATKIYAFESEKEIQMKINAAKGSEEWAKD